MIRSMVLGDSIVHVDSAIQWGGGGAGGTCTYIPVLTHLCVCVFVWDLPFFPPLSLSFFLSFCLSFFLSFVFPPLSTISTLPHVFDPSSPSPSLFSAGL